MNRAIQIMNYFIIVAAIAVAYVSFRRDDPLLDMIWPLVTIITIFLGRRLVSRFWLNLAYFGTFFYIFGSLTVVLPMHQFITRIIPSYAFGLIGIIAILTFICSKLRLRSELLITAWTVFFLLNIYSTFVHSSVSDFFTTFNSELVISHMMNNFLPLLLLSIIGGLFIELENRRKLGRA